MQFKVGNCWQLAKQLVHFGIARNKKSWLIQLLKGLFFLVSSIFILNAIGIGTQVENSWQQ